MGSESNPIFGSEIDLDARDYEVQNEQDIQDVIEALDDEYPEEIGDYLRGDGGEYGGWAHDIELAAKLYPYLDEDWGHVTTALEMLDGVYAEAGFEEQTARVDFSEPFAESAVNSSMNDGGIDSPGDVEVGHDVLKLIEDEEIDLNSLDVEEEVRERVLERWKPDLYAQAPSEIGKPIPKALAINETAAILDDAYDYLYPEEDVRGWQSVLYVYDADLGIYRPRGETQIGEELEAVMGEQAVNSIVSEVVSKLKRRNRVDSWDMENSRPHPDRLVVGNGILDLQTGELDDYTADEYHRTRIDVDYRPEAECPEIDSFFRDIVAEGDVPTLYRVVAHTLSKEYVDEKAMILVGDGDNGKSAFLNLLEEFLSERNVAGRSLQKLSDDKWAPADLHRSLANLSGDMSEQEADDLSTFKELTGGDTLTADEKYVKPVRFTNYASLIFASNGVPELPDSDMAVWQRWVYLNFPNRFGSDGNKEAVPMRSLMSRITAESELEGLLARCVEEYQEYYSGRDFFPTVGSAAEVRKRMKKAAEPVYDFADELLVDVDPEEYSDSEDYMETKDRVREAYVEYAREEDLPLVDKAQFSKRLLNLRDFGVKSGESRAVGPDTRNKVYRGIQLSEEAEALLADAEDEGDEASNASLDDGEDYDLLHREEQSVRTMAVELDAEAEEIRELAGLPSEAASAVTEVVEDERSEYDGIGEELARKGGEEL